MISVTHTTIVQVHVVASLCCLFELIENLFGHVAVLNDNGNVAAAWICRFVTGVVASGG